MLPAATGGGQWGDREVIVVSKDKVSGKVAEDLRLAEKKEAPPAGWSFFYNRGCLEINALQNDPCNRQAPLPTPGWSHCRSRP